jgi:hypothetical protein
MRVPTNIVPLPITAGHDIVCLIKLNADKCVPFVACSEWAQANFRKFSRERRNQSVLPSLGFKPCACHSRPLCIKTKCDSGVYFPETSALKAAVKSIVC